MMENKKIADDIAAMPKCKCGGNIIWLLDEQQDGECFDCCQKRIRKDWRSSRRGRAKSRGGQEMRTTDTHVYFYGSVYSNWYSCSFVVDGVTFNCTEQYLMYKKAMLFNDTEIANKILATRDPYTQKRLGRQVKNYDDKVWSEQRYGIMVRGLMKKFASSPLREHLIQTEDRVLVEASPTDKIWGVGLSETDAAILDEKNWRGTNLLGKALMETRTRLKNTCQVCGIEDQKLVKNVCEVCVKMGKKLNG